MGKALHMRVPREQREFGIWTTIVPGLDPYKSYPVSVLAENAVGRGPPATLDSIGV